MLAIPLTAAVLLQATPTQMGLLVAMELAPFVLLSLPVGVWLDRVRKLPVYLWGQITVAVVLATVPLAPVTCTIPASTSCCGMPQTAAAAPARPRLSIR